MNITQYSLFHFGLVGKHSSRMCTAHFSDSGEGLPTGTRDQEQRPHTERDMGPGTETP